jgi:ElaB/YqjD/DUF883 family membrane-anchored ribosome-binding protein
MKHHKQTVHSTKEILDDLRALVADAEKIAADTLAENSDEIVDALRARYEVVQDRLAEMVDGARKKVSATAAYADDTMRANLYLSMAAAASVGVVVGVLLNRRCGK